MLKVSWVKYNLRFGFVAKTSRNEMTDKDTYFLRIRRSDNPQVYGLGECNLFRGLGADDKPDYEDRLQQICLSNVSEHDLLDSLPAYSSIRLGVETALADLRLGGRRVLFPSAWTEGKDAISINGLVWMGDKALMADRIRSKLDAGFRCLKLKIGGIDFDEEVDLLKYVRSRFPADVLQLRLDANGAFSATNAIDCLERLAAFDVHSIEQPVKAGQLELMARICRESPIPVALDEELIGVMPDNVKTQLLSYVRPAYIILKPALCGGFAEAEKWIVAAQNTGVGWWVTSALESNVGLNAIAQWTFAVTHGWLPFSDVHIDASSGLPQGLGTGMLYTNNIVSPLRQVRDVLVCDQSGRWGDIPGL